MIVVHQRIVEGRSQYGLLEAPSYSVWQFSWTSSSCVRRVINSFVSPNSSKGKSLGQAIFHTLFVMPLSCLYCYAILDIFFFFLHVLICYDTLNRIVYYFVLWFDVFMLSFLFLKNEFCFSLSLVFKFFQCICVQKLPFKLLENVSFAKNLFCFTIKKQLFSIEEICKLEFFKIALWEESDSLYHVELLIILICKYFLLDRKGFVDQKVESCFWLHLPFFRLLKFIDHNDFLYNHCENLVKNWISIRISLKQMIEPVDDECQLLIHNPLKLLVLDHFYSCELLRPINYESYNLD